MLTGLQEIASVGIDAHRGGYSRHLWQPENNELVEWFTERATRMGPR